MVELRTKSMKTIVAKPDDVARRWYIVDADAKKELEEKVAAVRQAMAGEDPAAIGSAVSELTASIVSDR